MNWTFEPYESYGPLRFGMTREQIVALQGEPETETSVFDSFGHLLDPAIFTEADFDEMRRTMILSWPDSETNGQRPEVTLFDGRLVDIHLVQSRDSLIVNGVDLWDRDRVRVILDLARFEEVMLYSGSDYYFESVGVRITAPRLWQSNGSISLMSKEGFDLEMNKSQPEEYAAGEITGREN